MSNISAEKAFDRAVDLIIHADKLTADWTGRIVTVQTSLVISEGVLFGWKGDQPSALFVSLAILIAVVGLFSLVFFTNVVVREHEYGHCFVEMVKRAEGSSPFLYSDKLTEVPGIRFARAITILKWVMSASWIIFIIVVLVWGSSR